MFLNKVIQGLRGIFFPSFLEKIFTKVFIYAWVIIIPLIVYPIEVNGVTINPRAIREVAFFSFGIMICSFLQKNIWLKLLVIWCVISWWLNYFTPKVAYYGLSNVFSALAIYIGFDYLFKTGKIKIDTVLRIICLLVILQFVWMLMQKIFNYDPVFYSIDPCSVSNHKMPLTGWSGNPSLLGVFFATNAFLLLNYFRIRKFPILFFMILPAIILLNNATTAICFAIGGIFYVLNKYKVKKSLYVVLFFWNYPVPFSNLYKTTKYGIR